MKVYLNYLPLTSFQSQFYSELDSEYFAHNLLKENLH